MSIILRNPQKGIDALISDITLDDGGVIIFNRAQAAHYAAKKLKKTEQIM